ncbi:MAG: histidine phosphatase family protein, partial [Thermomicrobiales bacterium]|nr:histidine phosphatase family protein [Thermomicrobiales bacterium]
MDAFNVPQLWQGVEAHPDFRVLFVRHAESDINIIPELEIPAQALPPDSGVTYPLSKLGTQQASAIGEKLAGTELIAIYSSTRTRCIQTATAIALHHEMTIALDDDLVEIAFIDPEFSMGMIQEDDVRAVMGRWQAGDIDAAAPNGGESLRQVFQRFIPAVQKIIAKHAAQAGTLVIVAHGGVMAGCLAAIFPNITP